MRLGSSLLGASSRAEVTGIPCTVPASCEGEDEPVKHAQKSYNAQPSHNLQGSISLAAPLLFLFLSCFLLYCWSIRYLHPHLTVYRFASPCALRYRVQQRSDKAGHARCDPSTPITDLWDAIVGAAWTFLTGPRGLRSLLHKPTTPSFLSAIPSRLPPLDF